MTRNKPKTDYEKYALTIHIHTKIRTVGRTNVSANKMTHLH